MLAKLLKYEMMALSRYLVPMHILLLLFSLVGRLLVTSRLDKSNIPKPLFIIFVLLYTIITLFVVFATGIIILYRFYKNLFTDEGYLSLTLPVTPNQHILSKSIAATIWILVDILAVCLSLSMLIMTPRFIKNISSISLEFKNHLGIGFNEYIWFFVIMLVLTALVSPMFSYVCIAIGQLFSSHRILGAVIACFVITTFVQILLLIIVFACGFTDTYVLVRNHQLTTSYWNLLSKMSFIFTVGEFALSYWGTHYILKNKINLN